MAFISFLSTACGPEASARAGLWPPCVRMAGRLWEYPASAALFQVTPGCDFLGHRKENPFSASLLAGGLVEWRGQGGVFHLGHEDKMCSFSPPGALLQRGACTGLKGFSLSGHALSCP